MTSFIKKLTLKINSSSSKVSLNNIQNLSHENYCCLNIAFWLDNQKIRKMKNDINAPEKIETKKNSVVKSELTKNKYIWIYFINEYDLLDYDFDHYVHERYLIHVALHVL